MMTPRPEDERDLRAAGWQRMPVIAELALFWVTSVAVSSLYGFSRLLSLPAGWICLILCLGFAEVMILRLKFWRTGVESALWIGGLLALIFSLPSSGKPEAFLVFAAAFLLAGIRLRNPIFNAIACGLVVAYMAAKDTGNLALATAVAFAIVAAALCVVRWRRPSTAKLVGILTVLMPIGGFIAYAIGKWTSNGAVVFLFVAIAIVDLAIGIHFRVRAPMIAAVPSLGIAVIAAHDFIPFEPETQMIIGGLVMFGAATAINRALRNRTSGLVVTPTKDSELREAMQVAAMIPAATPAVPAQGAEMHTGGGEFGGAGASGNF